MPNQNFNQGSVGITGGRTTRKEGEEGSRSTGTGRDYARQTASQSASTIISQVQELLDQQVVKGAKTVSNIASSAKRAADELETEAPQLAGLVRGMADRLQDYSRDLEDKSVTDIYRAASDFTRQQPAIVFGLGALAGFLALRTFKSNSSGPGAVRSGQRANDMSGEASHGS
jgi:ElaB/YqjD/DUF883 family membrane-anchored ribosome-binding protein